MASRHMRKNWSLMERKPTAPPGPEPAAAASPGKYSGPRSVNIQFTSIIQLYVKLAYTTNEYFVIYGKKSTIYRGTTYVSVSSLNRWCFCFKLCELKNALNLQSSILNYFIFRRAAKLPALLARPARLI